MSQRALFDTAPEPWELDANSLDLVASVVFAEPPHGPYDYLLPARFASRVKPGQRIQVPLGKGNRSIAAWCIAIGHRPRTTRPLKPILGIADEAPLISATMLKLTEWMSDHYLCPLGQLMQSVVPSGVRGRAGTREMTFLAITESMRNALDKVPNAQPGSKSKARGVRLGEVQLTEKQLDALRVLATSPRAMTAPELAAAAKVSLGVVGELRKKNLVVAQVRRIQQMEVEQIPLPREDHLQLNTDQRAALDAILKPLRESRQETILLRGVTGSGKTEIYIRAIAEVISFGRQAIVLVPEISLTPQTRQRFRSRFDRVAVLHSHLSDAERHWHWQQIASGEVQVVVGARSAIFAPTPHLGLIVIDEEHDASFKQGESPRYHARDVALQRAKLENVPLVLGSATPAMESYALAKAGQFRLVEMPNRVSDRPLPDVEAIDLRLETHNRATRGAVSRPLHRAIDEALKEEGQVILLLNRRGYSTHIQCPSCGFVAKCPDCDQPLTHHREAEKVICHYCEYAERAPAKCPDCGFDGIRYSGFGTERLEAEIASRFPGVPALRMDSDTMQKPGSHERALDKFRAGEVKILLGTQMIAKGLDFPNVTLVGVINADTALHFPDFRAAERTFQLVTQVAGRTGRGDKGGRVLVQTFNPEHYAIQAALKHDYLDFAAHDLPQRERLHYPPYGSLIRLIIRGEQEVISQEFAETTAERLRAALKLAGLELRLLGPAPCPIAKLRGKFRFHILLASADGAGLRRAMREQLPLLEAPDEVQWVVDVDPVDLL